VAHPVTIDRTHQVMSGCLLESTGWWHYGIRSVQTMRPIKPLSSASIWWPNARARPVTLVHERVHLSNHYCRKNEIQCEIRGIHRGSRAGATGHCVRVQSDRPTRPVSTLAATLCS
jgi:hypothetical protein